MKCKVLLYADKIFCTLFHSHFPTLGSTSFWLLMSHLEANLSAFEMWTVWRINAFQSYQSFIAITFNFPLGYSIMKVQANQDGFKINNRRQLLVYADYINWQGRGMNATKKIKNDSLIASKMDGLRVSKLCNCGKTTKIWHRNKQIRTNQNKGITNSENDCYH